MKRLRRTFVLTVLACCAVLNVILAGLYLHIRVDLAQAEDRLKRIETMVERRDRADPLEARECVELESGGSPQNPCMTTIRQLAMAPQRYHDRWVMVLGLYAGGFEMSALFPPQENRSIMASGRERHAALWVQLALPSTPKEMPLIHVSGRFKRGPSGHMSEYFGELTDAKLHGQSSEPER